MKFAIFREIGKGKRKFLLEWDQKELREALLDRFSQYLITNKPEDALYFAFNKLIEDFKKQSIRIP